METLTGRQALVIQAIAGLLDYKVEKDTPMFGKKYRRFSFNGKVFVANSEDAFCAAFDKGIVYSVNLDSNAEGQLSLVGFTTTTQEINMAKTEVIIKSYTVENYLQGKLVAPEELIAL
jgi:hypothetical protein